MRFHPHVAALKRCLDPATVGNGAGVLDRRPVYHGVRRRPGRRRGGAKLKMRLTTIIRRRGRGTRPRKARRVTCSSARGGHDGGLVCAKGRVRDGAAPCRPHPCAAVGQENMELISDWYPRVDWGTGHSVSGSTVLLVGDSLQAQRHLLGKLLAWSIPNRDEMPNSMVTDWMQACSLDKQKNARPCMTHVLHTHGHSLIGTS